jgi:hypothetical protein
MPKNIALLAEGNVPKQQPTTDNYTSSRSHWDPSA